LALERLRFRCTLQHKVVYTALVNLRVHAVECEVEYDATLHTTFEEVAPEQFGVDLAIAVADQVA
jgi:hypothetical protein